MKVVRLIVYEFDHVDDMTTMMGMNQPDGFRQWGFAGRRKTMQILTLHRGGWVRSLWKVWRHR